MLGQNIGRVGLPDMSAGGRPSLTLDFVSIPVLNEKITFSRSSGATWFNSAGILQGVDFSATSNTIGTGSKSFTLTATASVNRYWAAGDTVLISDQANSANNMVGTVTSYNASTQVLVCNITSTGGSGTLTAWRIGSTMPRFDYNPSTLAAQGLLIEEARTNLCLQSADFGTTWTPTNTTVTTNAVVSPDSTTNADNIFETTTNGEHYVRQSFTGLTANTVYTITVFVKDLGGRNMRIRVLDTDNVANGYQISVSPSLGTIVQAAAAIGAGSSVTGTITSVNNGWYRVTLSGNAGATCTKYLLDFFSLTGTTSSFAGDITKGLTLYGAQLEAGAFPTSYIPTTTTALTRSADVASVNTLSPWYNATEGTLYADVAVDYTMPASLFPALASLNDNTSANRIELGFVTSAVASFEISVGGSIVTSRYPSVAALNRRVSGAYKANDSAVAVNGAAAQATTPTSASLPTVTKLDIGARAGGSRFTGWVRRITYYPRRLSNAELQAITT